MLELRIPPVVLVLTTAGLMWLASWITPELDLSMPWRFPSSAILALLGAAICISGIVAFRRARTTVNPLVPSSASSLVTSGIYKLTRNPMYLGFLAALVGWGVFLSNALSLGLILGFGIYLDRFQIRPEERALASRFGQDFSAYKARVRRWI